MKAHGYHMPELPNPFCSKNWMLEVRNKKCACPMVGDISFKPCLYPPTTAVLTDIIVTTIEQ